MGYAANSLGVANTWSPTFTGFSTDPTVIASYIVIGKLCYVNVHTTVNGTSNATDFTMTLPFTANRISRNHLITCVNNGATVTATLCDGRTAVGSNVLTLYTTLVGGAWTGSGTKAANFDLVYEIQ